MDSEKKIRNYQQYQAHLKYSLPKLLAHNVRAFVHIACTLFPIRIMKNALRIALLFITTHCFDSHFC